MILLKKFRKEVLKKSSYSFDARRKLHKKIKKFNKKHNVSFWVDTVQMGESDNYKWVLIRKGGEYGDIVYEKKLRKISQNFLNKIEKLKKKIDPRLKCMGNQLSIAFE